MNNDDENDANDDDNDNDKLITRERRQLFSSREMKPLQDKIKMEISEALWPRKAF